MQDVYYLIFVFAAAVFFVALGVVYALKENGGLSNLRLSSKEAGSKSNALAADPAVEAFFAEVRDGLRPNPVPSQAPVSSQAPAPAVPTAAPVLSLQEVLDSVTKRFAVLRPLVSELALAADGAGRQKVLSRLREHIDSIKETTHIPELQPVWTLASAVEGLLKQLSRETGPVNPSAQRTAVAAIDLLQALCIRHLNPNLATDPPVRILAVDDDEISRRAIAFALKKAFSLVALAADGKATLELASRHAYDVIFLDVEMPDMDGFELCTKIRETNLNRTTPVVFVTRHSDFNSRAKSTLKGGQDLIGKPYLSFEITVKALTLVMRNRLEGRTSPREAAMPIEYKSAVVSHAPASTPDDAEHKTETPTPTEDRGTEDGAASPGKDSSNASSAITTTTNDDAAAGEHPAGAEEVRHSAAVLKPPVECLPDTFSAWSVVFLENIRSQLHAAMLCNVPEELQEFIVGLYLAVHNLSEESERGGFATIHRLSSALEKMLKKLMEKPQFCTPSALNAAMAAIDLLGDLPCRVGDFPEVSNLTTKILVVDDDPVARRAICGAIQLVFCRPDEADSGETVLAMASENSFDLIFLDVLMPGIDGFTACSKIRETQCNRHTPVVFITNHDDGDSREKAATSGGCGFIPKPIFSSQITLTALTWILRARLDQTESEAVVSAEQEPCLV